MLEKKDKYVLAYSLNSLLVRCVNNYCGRAEARQKVSVKRSTVGKINNVRLQALTYSPIATFIVEAGFLHATENAEFKGQQIDSHTVTIRLENSCCSFGLVDLIDPATVL